MAEPRPAPLPMLQDIAPSLYQVAYAPRPPREGSPLYARIRALFGDEETAFN